MRPLAALLLLTASLALPGCTNSCQDLGTWLCRCSLAGIARDNCNTEIQNQLNAVGVRSTDKAHCAAALSTCNAPPNVNFCEWIGTTCGKASCGLSNEPVDATTCPP